MSVSISPDGIDVDVDPWSFFYDVDEGSGDTEIGESEAAESSGGTRHPSNDRFDVF